MVNLSFAIKLTKKKFWQLFKIFSKNIIHKSKYIIRLDDASETQDNSKWRRIELLLDDLDIKPIVAVVPLNKDKNLEFNSSSHEFWESVKRWEKKGWTIALHGYQHKLKKINRKNLILPFYNESEFGGLALSKQREKIKKAYEIMTKNNIFPKIWIAPNHAFDKNTLIALKKETPINIVSDGIALYPFRQNNIIFIPQQLWRTKERFLGIWTICLHPNNISEEEFNELERDLKKYYFKSKIVDTNFALSKLNNDSFLSLIFQNFVNNSYRFYFWFKWLIKNFIRK